MISHPRLFDSLLGAETSRTVRVALNDRPASFFSLTHEVTYGDRAE